MKKRGKLEVVERQPCVHIMGSVEALASYGVGWFFACPLMNPALPTDGSMCCAELHVGLVAHAGGDCRRWCQYSTNMNVFGSFLLAIHMWTVEYSLFSCSA